MFDDVSKFQQVLYTTFGESGAEAFNDAVIYYLSNNTDWPCEEDKLVLLSYLYFNPCATSYYEPKYNPLKHFKINITKEN